MSKVLINGKISSDNYCVWACLKEYYMKDITIINELKVNGFIHYTVSAPSQAYFDQQLKNANK